jgi:hypothetical protein
MPDITVVATRKQGSWASWVWWSPRPVVNQAHASYSDDDTRPRPVVAHSVTRRSASALTALSSSPKLAPSAGSVGNGPAGARSASGPIDRPISIIEIPAPGAGKRRPTCRWSLRCFPTSAASSRQATPTASSSLLGPIPDSIRICGEPTAPALRITSLAASATTVAPSSLRYSTPVARSPPGPPLQDHLGGLRAADHLEIRPLLGLPLEERGTSWTSPDPRRAGSRGPPPPNHPRPPRNRTTQPSGRRPRSHSSILPLPLVQPDYAQRPAAIDITRSAMCQDGQRNPVRRAQLSDHVPEVGVHSAQLNPPRRPEPCACCAPRPMSDGNLCTTPPWRPSAGPAPSSRAPRRSWLPRTGQPVSSRPRCAPYR